MVEPTESGAAIEQLLQQRKQYQDWLSRLAGAGNAAPDAVRLRVRADYEARLRAVMDELRTHGDTIGADLDRFRASQAELQQREAEAQERIAEAEVRHAVGEFEESKWQSISEEANRGLAGTRAELGRVQAEIARLAEVQSLITAAPPAVAPAAAPTPTAADTPAPPPAVPEPEWEPEIDMPDEPPAAAAPQPGAAPRFVPRGPAPSAPDDELAFLQSVTGHQAGAARSRGSGGHPAPPEAAAAPPPVNAAPAAATGKAAAAGSPAKTLKCAECGAMNRPSEWYCERCGAELAAL